VRKELLVIFSIIVYLCLYSVAYGAEVKVMRTVGLIENGEECLLIPEKEAYLVKKETLYEIYPAAPTLKQVTKEGWKIVYVKEFPGGVFKSTEFLIIFTKD
jgi:hypothetical protein